MDQRQPLSPTLWRWLAALLIVGAAAVRVLWLATWCNLDLAPDEAHYWDWSRHLDWSYYSKGPAIAWLIRLSCELFGGISLRLTGTEMLAVRLPAVLCGSLLLASMYLLTVQVFGREKLAFWVVALALTTPALAAGSTLMTIDAPYTCCWGWALVAAHRAVFRDRTTPWIATGFLVGLGILFKYTMIVFVPSLLLFLAFTPSLRHLLASRRLWLMLILAGASCLPILLWNADHEWVTFRHVGGLAGAREQATTIFWLGPLRYFAVQAGLWLVFWLVAWARAMWSHAPWREDQPGIAYLWWMSAPMFALFFAFGFKTNGGEPNWPVAAYLSGFVLAMAWLTAELQRGAAWSRRCTQAGLVLASAAGLVLTVLVHHSALAYPVLVPLAGEPSAQHPFPLRRFDPTLRLRGWRQLAEGIDEVRGDLESRHDDPVLAGTGWNMPGLIGFYCAGHPSVYSLGLALGDRRSQYDFWRPNPVWDPEPFVGRTFLIVSASALDLRGIFERVEAARVITCRVTGQPVATWYILVGHGYRGFKADSASSPHSDF